MDTKSPHSGSQLRRRVLWLYTLAGTAGNKAIRTEERIPTIVKVLFLAFLLLGSSLLAALFLSDKNLAILDPQGIVAIQQKRLITVAAVMSLFVVIPVFAMTIYIAWKYRASNDRAPYRPDFDHSVTAETIWWAIPIILIFALSVITVKSSHDLDPYKKIASEQKPLTIQVIALDWKWLFLYPDHQVAAINYVKFPTDTPVTLKITSDGPMNALWIPQLGSQVYAMNGMSTELNLMAIKEGDYTGSSANISGAGFAGMKFTAEATSESDFNNWLQATKRDSPILDINIYKELTAPSTDHPVELYYMADTSLYDKVINKYMMPNAELRGAM